MDKKPVSARQDDPEPQDDEEFGAVGMTPNKRRRPTPAQSAAARESIARNRRAIAPPTGGKAARWMIAIPLPVDERPPYLDAAQGAGQTVGEWVLDAMRAKLRGVP